MTAGRRWRRNVFGCGAIFVAAACHGTGAATITRDRFDYVWTLSESWKRQTLINLVRLRYGDAPAFLDVTSVIASYAWEADVNLSSQLAPVDRGDTFVALGASGHYADRPTITYTPMAGEQFARSLMASLPVTTILFLLESGYPADAILRVCVNSINGLENQFGGPGNPREGSPRFHELLSLLKTNSGSAGIEILLKRSKDKDALVLVLRAPQSEPQRIADERFRELLGLDPHATSFEVLHGPFASTTTEIAIQTRSMMQVLIDLSSQIEVPSSDISEGRAYALSHDEDQQRMYPALFRVRSGDGPPPDAHVSVRYRDHWFWIDDRDVKSKLAFNFLMLMFSLTETGSQQGAPVVTVPVR